MKTFTRFLLAIGLVLLAGGLIHVHSLCVDESAFHHALPKAIGFLCTGTPILLAWAVLFAIGRFSRRE